MNFPGREEAGCSWMCATAADYIYLSPSLIVVCACVSSLCAFLHVIACVHMYVSTDVCTCVCVRKKRMGPVKASEVEGSVKMMFDMRKEARSRGTCSVRQQVA